MKQLLEQIPQWGPIVGLVICLTIFLLVLIYQWGDRRVWYAQKMSAMPLRDGDTLADNRDNNIGGIQTADEFIEQHTDTDRT